MLPLAAAAVAVLVIVALVAVRRRNTRVPSHVPLEWTRAWEAAQQPASRREPF